MINIRRFIPRRLKNILRFLWYKNERRKVFKERQIRKAQDKIIVKSYPKNIEKLIVFLIDGANWHTGYDNISGGILSIASIYQETSRLKDLHHSQVIMCTLPNEYLLLKHTMFPNDINVFRYDQLLNYFTGIKDLMIHIPEYRVTSFYNHLSFLKNKLGNTRIHINVLNQRIDLMPSPECIYNVSQQVSLVTQTTAHDQYTTLHFRNHFGIPLHKLSVFGSPEKYNRIPLDQKKNVIALSPDPHPLKFKLIEKIRKDTSLTVVEISNMPYLEYLDLVSYSKFMITLGEGLDFYFIETVFSGGVAFTLTNTEFFTDDFSDVPGIYANMDLMLENIIQDIKRLESSSHYSEWNELQAKPCKSLYKYDDYVRNVKKFYQREYTYV